MSDYWVGNDPYRWPNFNVLANNFGLVDGPRLQFFGGWYVDLTRLQSAGTIDAITASFNAGSGVP